MRARANGHTATAYSAWPEHAILDDSGVVALIARRAGRELRPQACTVHAARAAHSARVGSGATAVRSAPVVCSGSVSMANSGPHTNRKPVRPPSPLSASLCLGVGSTANASAASGAPMRSIRIECACRRAVRRSLESSIPALGALPVFHFHRQSSYATRISGQPVRHLRSAFLRCGPAAHVLTRPFRIISAVAPRLVDSCCRRSP